MSITRQDEAELIGYYHLARTALSHKPMSEQGRWGRLNWAAKEFHKRHPDVSVLRAYKELDSLLRH